MLQGVCVPAMQAVLAQWAPPMDRTVMVAYTYSGMLFFSLIFFLVFNWLIRFVVIFTYL